MSETAIDRSPSLPRRLPLLPQTGWVCDPDRILTMYEHVHLEGLIDSISTECVHQCGDAESGYRVWMEKQKRHNSFFSQFKLLN